MGSLSKLAAKWQLNNFGRQLSSQEWCGPGSIIEGLGWMDIQWYLGMGALLDGLLVQFLSFLHHQSRNWSFIFAGYKNWIDIGLALKLARNPCSYQVYINKTSIIGWYMALQTLPYQRNLCPKWEHHLCFIAHTCTRIITKSFVHAVKIFCLRSNTDRIHSWPWCWSRKATITNLWLRKINERNSGWNCNNLMGCLYKCGVQIADAGVVTTVGMRKIESTIIEGRANQNKNKKEPTSKAEVIDAFKKIYATCGENRSLATKDTKQS